MKIIASILLVLAIGLSGCQTFAQKQKEKGKKAAVSKATAKPREENADVDFEAFVGRLRKAVAAHDVQTLSAMIIGPAARGLPRPAASDRAAA